MKLQNVLALGAAIQSTSAAAVPYGQAPLAEQPSTKTSLPHAEKFLIELAPYDTRWVTEEEKWELKLVSQHVCFFRSGADNYASRME
jgi:bacterial leucyl aminopeptidase